MGDGTVIVKRPRKVAAPGKKPAPAKFVSVAKPKTKSRKA